MTKKTISFWHPASLISTCFGIGKIPFAPGTFGSLVGVVIAYIGAISFSYIISGVNPMNFFTSGNQAKEFDSLAYNLLIGVVIFISLMTVFSVISTKIYLKHSLSLDPKEVVVDELVGVWIALITLVTLDVVPSKDSIFYNWFSICCVAFLLFRFFDIVKPGPVGWADRNVKGAWGVMLDDIIAGVLAGIISAIIFLVF